MRNVFLGIVASSLLVGLLPATSIAEQYRWQLRLDYVESAIYQELYRGKQCLGYWNPRSGIFTTGTGEQFAYVGGLLYYNPEASRFSYDLPDPGEDALEEVNFVRKRRGLQPFIRDALLTLAARRAAQERAASLCAGHTANDFGYLPAGGSAAAAGCAAWTPDWGWGACCTYDSYTYAGAAWVMGRDGRRYMHLFVR